MPVQLECPFRDDRGEQLIAETKLRFKIKYGEDGEVCQEPRN